MYTYHTKKLPTQIIKNIIFIPFISVCHIIKICVLFFKLVILLLNSNNSFQ